MNRYASGELLYLDNAATSFPKPPQVLQAVQRFLMESGGNPGRGAHILANRAADSVYSCRETAAEFFHASPERVFDMDLASSKYDSISFILSDALISSAFFLKSISPVNTSRG